MVGVPGKSQACHNCRRRRVKCDFGRPSCLRCDKAGLLCAGYNRDFIFVNQTPTKLYTSATSVLSEMKREENYRKLHPNLQYDQELLLLLSNVGQSSMSPLEYRGLALALLKKLYLPQPHHLSRGSELGRSPYSWLHAVCQMQGHSQALDYSLLAFSAIQVYTTRIGTASLDQALRLYTEGIERLRTDLEDPSTRFLDETVAAIVVLSTCELFISPTDRGWQAHIRGASEILRLRSPTETPTPIWTSLCSRLRIVCILHALAKRESPPLTPSQWREITKNESAFDELIDTASDVPVLFEEGDMIMQRVYDSTAEIWARPVLRSCMAAASKMYDIIARIRADTPGAAYWAVPSTLHNPADDEYGNKLFPFSLEFDSIHSGVVFVLCWGVLVSILSSVVRLYAFLTANDERTAPLEEILRSRNSSPASDQSNSPDLDWPSLPVMEAESERLARHLCQSIEYMYRADMGILGPQSTTFAQWVIRRFFQDHDGYKRELAWVMQIKNMKGPGHWCGLQLMTFQDEDPATPWSLKETTDYARS